MKPFAALLASALVASVLSVPVAGHEHAPGKEAPHAPMGGEEAMRSQHERMARFREAATALTEAFVRSDREAALDAATLLIRSLAGHERDIPHKNASRSKEFHALFTELGKRTEALRGLLAAGRLARAAESYGRVLEVCVSCHAIFRD